MCQFVLHAVNRQRHVILWVIEFLLHQRKDCRDHVFGKNLAHDSKSHAHLDKVCALEILAGKKKQGTQSAQTQHNFVRDEEISGAKTLHSPSIQCSPEEEATRDSRSGTGIQPDNLQNRGHVLRFFLKLFWQFVPIFYKLRSSSTELKTTHQLFSLARRPAGPVWWRECKWTRPRSRAFRSRWPSPWALSSASVERHEHTTWLPCRFG